MALSQKPQLCYHCFNEPLRNRIYNYKVPTRFHLQDKKNPLLPRRLCLITGDNNASGLSDPYNSINPNPQGSVEENEASRGSANTKDLLKTLKRYGISGILSYGLLNTLYYLTTFLIVWAIALAPFVDRGLSWFTIKFKFESQEKSFMAIVGFCFGLAFILFLATTLLWA